MIIINYTEAFLALERFIDGYNATKNIGKEKIKQTVAATAKEMIRVYGRDLVRASQSSLFCIEELPAFSTNNQHLSKISRASPRTIQRHIKKLVQAKVITSKVWHGSKANYELWINPELLCISYEKSKNPPQSPLKTIIDKSLKIGQKQGFSLANRTKRPHKDPGNNIKNIIKDVDSGENKRCELSLTNYFDFSGHTGKKVRDFEETGKKGRPGLASGKLEKEIKLKEDGRAASLDLFSNLLWTLAKQTLYADKFLTASQVENAPKLIRKWYEPVPNENLPKIHRIYVERLRLARKYVQKDPTSRYVRLPHQFFDPAYENGFRVTKGWWEKEKIRKFKISQKQIYHHQIKKLKDNLERPAHNRADQLLLYRQCEKVLLAMGNEDLLHQFYQWNQENNKQAIKL